MKTQKGPRVFRLYSLICLAALIIVGAVAAAPFYSAAFRSSLEKSSAKVDAAASRPVLETANSISRLGRTFKPLVPTPGPSTVGIATYAPDCATPKTDFNLGDTVCAKATGVPVTIFSWHVAWVDTVGFIRQTDTAIADDLATYTYTLPSTTTSVVNGQTVDNRGTWRVNLTRFSGAIQQTASFTVHETANPVSDVFVQKFIRDPNSPAQAGGNIAFIIVVGNQGPDPATAVHLVDSAPSGSSLVQFTQQSGPACVPVAEFPNDCTIATLTNGDRAEFTAIYGIDSGTAAGTVLTTSDSVSSTTVDPNTDNNTSSVQFETQAASGAGTCSLTCPTDITTDANTTEGGLRGAHVTFEDATSAGDCGSVSSSPASGSFFPVGTTLVHATSETGGGTCTFTVTVEDPNGNTTISCPSNKEANADSNCEATVTIGTPTATGDNVTISGVRSDGKPMYNCDCFPPDPNDPTVACDIHGACTRRADAPFAAGVTTITWTAYSHDTPGPYASPEDELAHRTGNASCTQTVTVNDITPPTITATDQTASADANCQAAVPDFSTIATVSDNCACASSDNSETCVSRQDITVTQDVAPGTLVGLGPHTIHLTANDGSSNNDGAGNSTTISVTFTVVDTTPPTFTFVPANVTAYTGPGATTCDTVVDPGTATATDNCGPVTITRSPSGSTFPVGTTTITWTAKDGANNPSTATQTVTVIDNTPPVISCPSNIVLEPTCPSGAIATYTAPAGTDNCPGATTARTAGGASGTVFPIGTTTVTYTVTDAASNSASCSFTVTVLTVFQTIENLKTSVDSSSLTGTQKQGLIAKLNAAEDALAQGHTNTACQKLADFINSVQNYIDHGNISVAEGNAWINSAAHVRNTLGCTNSPCT